MPVKLSPLLVAVALMLLTGCPSVEPTTTAPQPVDPAEPALQPVRMLDFEIVADGVNSPIEAGEKVYRDAGDFASLAERLRMMAYEPDFEREAVLYAAIDASTGGFRLAFDSVYVMPAGGIAAIYTIEEPGPDCFVTQALTRPFQVIAVRGIGDESVRFIQRRQTYSC